MNPDHARFAEWDSAYVLGALSPAERREYEEHLESCELCRRSVAELTPIPGLLARLTPERAAVLLEEPAGALPAPRPELLVAVRREGRRRRLRRMRLGLVAAAAAVVVVLTAILVPLALVRPAADAQTVAFDAVTDVPVSAIATLTQVGWGTRIELDCSYGDAGRSTAPEGGWPYALYVVDRDGNSSEVSSWRANPGKTARLEAGTSLGLEEIASLEVRALGSGDVLLVGDPD
ncbi:zf-HC2 domain-containing protein [Agromyces sp. ISL-38]|uniref:anti-sigma factor family protein n=1 Tax=Agromyces sp. ISL-38 TaxID=2819107 RepID=UPI001BED281F|nr:zf-HC2 domain-containing protein [Agromyces sp. ISL-38]MBT2498886.1 zf-HC2 domain-containing protein [Agromyces sp. ISL-38]MBT2516428.1 zf-HC2 domain-containing protein [Streptomyces sp. ISL-90]